MNKSEIQVHRAPRFPDARDIETNPQKVVSDLILVIKQLWQDKVSLETRINWLEEKVESEKGIRDPLRYL